MIFEYSVGTDVCGYKKLLRFGDVNKIRNVSPVPITTYSGNHVKTTYNLLSLNSTQRAHIYQYTKGKVGDATARDYLKEVVTY